MKRKFNESVELDVVRLKKAHPGISANAVARLLQKAGANIDERKERNKVYMVIEGLSTNDIANELYKIRDIKRFLNESASFPRYEDVILEGYDYDEDEELNDCTGPDCDDDLDECGIDECGGYNEDDDLDECGIDECGSYNEDEDFDECEKFESYRPLRSRRSLAESRRLMARRKGCCPPKRSIRKISLAEAIGSKKGKRVRLNEAIINRAMRKALNENRRKNRPTTKLEEAKRALGPAKCKLIINALKSKKSYLYENKRINGKKMNRYTSKQLYNILKTVNELKKRIEKKLTVLNEALSSEEIRQLKEQYKIKARLIKLLDEELTYRLTLKNLLREADENPLEPLPMGPEVGKDGEESDGDVNPDDDVEGTEEVELSRVVITLDSQEAADEFIKACVDEGIPEDVLEIEEDEDEESEDNEDEESEGEDNEEENNEQPNESYHFRRVKRLLEADDTEDEGDDTEGDDTEDNDNAEGDDTEGDDTEGENDGEVKVVLTDTDYIDKMAAVLDNVYGIGKEEFEENIGGEIVSDDENSDDEDSDEEGSDDDKSDDKKSEKKSSKGDDAVDQLSDEDLKDLFGGE